MTDLARLRQAIYLVASAGLLPPTDDRIRFIRDATAQFDALGLAAIAPAHGWWEYADIMAHAVPQDLAAEHTRLFGSGMDGALCSLQESQWLGSNLHGDPATIESGHRKVLDELGITTAGAHTADHLVVSLEALAVLSGLETNPEPDESKPSIRAVLDGEHRLLTRMERWVPQLASAVADRDRSGVYAPLLRAIEATVRHDRDLTGLTRMAL